MRIPRWHRDTKLDFDVRRNSKLWAHDEYSLCGVGDMVRTCACASAWLVLLPRAHRLPTLHFAYWHNARSAASLTSQRTYPRARQVRIEPCRALSKRKAHVVAEIIRKEDGTPPPSPFPKW